MGEHWINLRHAVRDAFDPTHPPVLLYAHRGDEPVLVGAAFVAFKDAGEPLPGPAFLRHAWHEHSGTLEDELFAGEHGRGDVDDRFAVMVLHVWSAAPLAGGPFDVQNWRLPWLRASLDPASASFEAARALSLLTSVDYYRDALLRDGVPHDDRRALEALLADARADVQGVLDDAAATPDADRLQATWQALVARISTAWPASRESLERLGADPRVHLECVAGDNARAARDDTRGARVD